MLKFLNPRAPLVTLYGPVLVFLFVLIADRPFPNFLPGLTGSELGFSENFQALILLIAFFIGLPLLKVPREEMPGWVRTWVLIGLVCVVYIFLEEISYGQHFFGWQTPTAWAHINDQDETNLHNVSSWFDQKPRIVLDLGVFIGGIIVPILRRFRPQAVPSGTIQLILPENVLFPTAVLAIVPQLFHWFIHLIGHPEWEPFVRTSEVQELYFYYFILLYLVCLRYRFAQPAKASQR